MRTCGSNCPGCRRTACPTTTRALTCVDWPGVPGIARNARALADLGLDEDVLAGVLAGNAMNVYPGLANVLQTIDVTPY